MTTETREDILINAHASLRELDSAIRSGTFLPRIVKPAGFFRFAVYGEGEGIQTGNGNRRIVAATTDQVEAITGIRVAGNLYSRLTTGGAK